MKKILGIVWILLVTAVVASAQNGWAGTYVFEEDGGRNAGGTAIFITHELNVMETDDGLRATIQSNGYQTSKDLICTAKAAGNKLSIYFESYGENNMFESYSPGDLLLTLEKRTAKGKTQLLTFWGKFEPVIPEKPQSGKVFFVKSKN